MDILDFIGKVIEFSEKGEEYSDEIKAIKATLESLHLTVQQIKPNRLPDHIENMLNESLQESQNLLKKASPSSTSWLTNFKMMLPGSSLQKIREKNQQLLHIINLINLHLNSIKNGKRSSDITGASELEEPSRLKRLQTLPIGIHRDNSYSSTTDILNTAIFGATLEDDEPRPAIQGATQPDDVDIVEQMEPEEPVAFRLRVLYDLRLGSTLRKCKDFVPLIEKKWENDASKYTFQRVEHAYLPMGDLQRVSRDHAVINAVKKAQRATVNKININIAATVPDDDKLYGATIEDKIFGATLNDDGEVAVTEDTDNAEDEEDEFVLEDISLNGTYYLKGANLLNFPNKGLKITGDFKLLKKNEKICLAHGDIIGLVMQKPQCNELIFGFQFLTE